MAYVGNTARLCQAIVDGDIDHVEDWLSQEGADPNTRDYTGRTPLHLAVISSTPQIVKCLVDHGARLVARLADGRNALHLAAARGNVEMIRILLERSESNEEEENEKQDRRRKALHAAHKDSQVYMLDTKPDVAESDENSDDETSDGELVNDATSDEGDGARSMATGSFVKINKDDDDTKNDDLALDDDQSEPDVYAIDAVAWDSKCSALHLAVLGGHCEAVKLLCQEFGSDVLIPVKIDIGEYRSDSKRVFLPLVLVLTLPLNKALRMAETLLSLGATSSQAEVGGITAFQRYIKNGNAELFQCLWDNDKISLNTAINHVAIGGYWNWSSTTTPLMTAIDKGDSTLVLKLLEIGAKPTTDFDSWMKGRKLLEAPLLVSSVYKNTQVVFLSRFS